MKILSLYAATPNYDLGLSHLSKSIYNVFQDLDLVIKEINLKFLNLPYFDNGMAENVKNIVEEIKTCDGIIFLTSSTMFAPSGVMQTFLEHLEFYGEKDFLRDKNCMIVAISKNFGETETVHYLSKVINYFGGFDSVKIPLNQTLLSNIKNIVEYKEIFEKQAEDFYRILKLNRKFFPSNIPAEIFTKKQLPPFDLHEPDKTNILRQENLTTQSAQLYNQMENKELQNTDKASSEYDNLNFQKEISPNNEAESQPKYKNFNQSLYEPKIENTPKIEPSLNPLKQDKISILAPKTANPIENDEDIITPQHEEDINELTNFFAKKYTPKDNNIIVEDDSNFYFDNFEKPTESQPREKTIKQLTQSLPHYFKSILAKSDSFVVALYITGDETFEGYMQIKNGTCEFYDGQPKSSDIVILSDSKVWKQILEGKKTIQKSFMTGQLKVKGNFVILSKLDQLFEPII